MGSSLVRYYDWLEQTQLLRKLEQTFLYIEIKEEVEEHADSILAPYGLKSRLMPTLTTGVQGDRGTYEFVLMLETPENPDYEAIGKLSRKLTNEIPEINRIVMTVTASGGIEDLRFIDDYFR